MKKITANTGLVRCKEFRVHSVASKVTYLMENCEIKSSDPLLGIQTKCCYYILKRFKANEKAFFLFPISDVNMSSTL